MPTSRYCDHSPFSCSRAFRRAAFSEPGTMLRRLSPIRSRTWPRISSARCGSPPARSSITRSTMLEAKVTPAALITCRSAGANKLGRAASRSLPLLASNSATLQTSCARLSYTRADRSSSSHSPASVGASALRSNTPSSCSSTGAGPGTAPGSQIRPINVPVRPSSGSVLSGVRITGRAMAKLFYCRGEAAERHR
ncbi:hypothetical protein D9M68_749050 [compost metagenome]